MFLFGIRRMGSIGFLVVEGWNFWFLMRIFMYDEEVKRFVVGGVVINRR